MTITLDGSTVTELDQLARSSDRNRDSLIAEAIEAYLDIQRWQIAHIKEGLRQAEAGEFADPEEVAAIVARWR